jgi:hypothetical protein
MKQVQEGTFTSRRFDLRTKLILGTATAILIALVGAAIALLSRPKATEPIDESAGDALAGKFSFQVGDPGPGQPAPPIQLMSTLAVRSISPAFGARRSCCIFRRASPASRAGTRREISGSGFRTFTHSGIARQSR